jgi:hypothetical protein
LIATGYVLAGKSFVNDEKTFARTALAAQAKGVWLTKVQF